MNGKWQTKLAAGFTVLSILVLSTTALLGQAKPAPKMTIATSQSATRTIIVSLQDRRLALLEDGAVKKVYRVAVGRAATPSPTGTFTIVDRVTNPTYYHSGKVIPPGPENPVGTRWMGLSQKGYGIHGTNEPHSVGRAVSHGCIRMGRRDLQDLFAQVRTGDVVEIVGERDAETVAIFGTPAMPVAPVTAVLAKANPQAPAVGQATDASAAADSVAPPPADR